MKKQLLPLIAALYLTLSVMLAAPLSAQTTVLYGMTLYGGSFAKGAIIEFNPSTSSENTVWSFGNDSDAAYPYGSLVYDAGTGIFYGMTSAGGSNNAGAVFSFNPETNAENVLWSFKGGTTDGSAPYGNLLYAGNGLFYGMTTTGGSNNKGTIISFNPSTNTDSMVWSFGGSGDGYGGRGSLIYDAVNQLYYGMTEYGGSHSSGTIFSFNTATNAEQVVWNFGGLANDDGANPYGSLVYDANNGLLYGLTSSGGQENYNGGVLFSYSPTAHTESIYASFGYDPGVYGGAPYGSLVAYDGLYYHTTSSGGNGIGGGCYDSYGTVLAFYPSDGGFNPDWYFSAMCQEPNDGAHPYGDLVYDAGSGVFWGMTNAGGVNNLGTIYKVGPYNVGPSESVVWNFEGGNDGSYPYGNLVLYTGCPATILGAITGADTVCGGAQINLADTSGGGTWTSSNGNIASVSTGGAVTGVSAGRDTIIYSVTNACGTAFSVTHTVTVLAAPATAVAGTDSACGSVSLTASGGTGYAWSGGSSPNTAADTFTTSNTYTVTVTGSNGCAVAVSQLVIVNTIPGATVTPNGTTTFCSGDSVILSANTESNYLWSTHATTQTITVGQSGNYTLTVTSAENCTAAAAPTVITVNSLPTAATNPNGSIIICTGDSVLLTANAETSYLWNTGATTQSVEAAVAGNYYVTVTDVNGCTAVSSPVAATVITSITPAIQITANPVGAVCAGTIVNFQSTGNGGGVTPAYQWKINGINAGTGTDSLSVSSLQTNDIVSCVLTSSSACANPDTAVSNSITVTVNPVVTPSVSIQAIGAAGCAGTPDTITASIANGGTSPTYNWQKNGTTVSTNSVYISNSLLSTDVIQCIFVSNALCASPDTVTSNSLSVTVNPPPTATITPSSTVSICSGDSVQLAAAGGNASYIWNTHATTQNISALLAGNYTVTVTNINSCTAVSAPVTVVVNQLPAAPGISRHNDTLTSTAASSYQWYLNGNALNNEVTRDLLITQNGIYSVQITDSNGCTNTSAAVNVNTLGITGVNADYTVQLYPNPNSGNFTLRFSDAHPRFVSLLDVSGRLISTQPVSLQKDFDCSSLTSGVYYLEIKDESGVQTMSVVLTK